MKPEQRKLNVGCGIRKKEDHWNVDIDPSCNPDQVIDLDQCPWPYEDNFFERISIENSLGYLGRDPATFGKIIQEMYRVSAPGAEWYVSIPNPHCDNALDDYFRVRTITPTTLTGFDQKLNFESVAKKTGESTYGFNLGVDIEVKDINTTIIPYWQEQLNNGMIGQKQLEIYARQYNNVIAVYHLFMTVHKPQRFGDWYTTQRRK
jgi:hypothetical protein